MEPNTYSQLETSSVQRGVVALLGVAPAISILLIAAGAGGTYLPAEYAWVAALVALVAWSPLPVAIPALVLQDARDAYRPSASTAIRAIGMLGYLVRQPGFVGRAAVTSLSGFALGVLTALIAL